MSVTARRLGANLDSYPHVVRGSRLAYILTQPD
jgi:hypothetical protein